MTKPTPAPELREADLDASVARLDSGSYRERCDAQAAIERRGQDGVAALRVAIREERLGVRGRLHAVWVLAHVEGPAAVPGLLDVARIDPEPRVRAQAVRAVADLADPALTRHRLDAGPGDAELATRLAELARGQDPRVVLEVVIALGRLGWKDAPAWLRTSLTDPDPVLAHAAMQTLRRSDDWGALLDLLDDPASGSGPWRGIVLRAIADCYRPEVADGLIARLKVETDGRRRAEYADLLTRIARKPGPPAYWGSTARSLTPTTDGRSGWRRCAGSSASGSRFAPKPWSPGCVRSAIRRRWPRSLHP
jgi:HEAT repeat protein